jgi:Cdc6-like AAA superfamily ATPase
MSDNEYDIIDDVQEFANAVEADSGAFDNLKRALANEAKAEAPSDPSEKLNPGKPTQYSLYGPGYMAMTPTVSHLPSGCYDVHCDNRGIFVTPTLKPSGLLLDLPEMRSSDVISIVDSFWNSEKDYKEGNEFVIGGAAFKAGLLIFGPPGSGKSSTIRLVTDKLVARGGTVFYASTSPAWITSFLTDFATIEPNRKSIVILEDIDSLIQRYSEAEYLEMLDSPKTINNVLFIATTNYPERLDPRIYNRPGRFAHVIKIGLPTPKMREAYLKAILKNHRDVDHIVSETNNFTIDHLTSLINSVYRQKKDLQKEITRIKILFKMPKSESKPLGIGANEWSE